MSSCLFRHWSTGRRDGGNVNTLAGECGCSERKRVLWADNRPVSLGEIARLKPIMKIWPLSNDVRLPMGSRLSNGGISIGRCQERNHTTAVDFDGVLVASDGPFDRRVTSRVSSGGLRVPSRRVIARRQPIMKNLARSTLVARSFPNRETVAGPLSGASFPESVVASLILVPIAPCDAYLPPDDSTDSATVVTLAARPSEVAVDCRPIEPILTLVSSDSSSRGRIRVAGGPVGHRWAARVSSQNQSGGILVTSARSAWVVPHCAS